MARKQSNPVNSNKPFPTALRTLMKARDINQKDLADYLGKTRQTISLYCNGESAPDLETLVKIAQFFDTSTDYLLGRTEDPSRHPCAADELGISAKAISLIKLYNKLESPDDLQGLSLLLESGKFLGLTGEITRFCKMTANHIKASDFYRDSSKNSNDPDSEYYKFKLSLHEELAVKEIEQTIVAKYPELKGEYCIVFGSNMVEYQRRSIVDKFDEILRHVSSYNTFRSGVSRLEGLLDEVFHYGND